MEVKDLTDVGVHVAYEVIASWESAMTDLPTEQAKALQAANQLSFSEPARAAMLVEELFPQLTDSDTLAPWYAMLIAVTGRVYSLSSFHRLDMFIEYFEQHRQQLAVYPPALQRQIDACYFGALVFRRPDHPHISDWTEACLQAFESDGEPLARLNAANFLLLYRIWNADFNGADVLRQAMTRLRESTDDVRARLMCYSLSALTRRMLVDYDGCLQDVEQGLALGEQSGIHFWDAHLHMQGAGLALSRENLEEAGQWLDKMESVLSPEHYLARSGYHYIRAWFYSLCAEPARAMQHCRDAVRLAAESGARYPEAIVRISMGQVYLEQHHLGAALREFRRARRLARFLPKHQGMQFASGLAQAHIQFKLGLRQRGLRALAQALAIGAQQHYANFPWWRSDVMARLCARALEEGIEPEYVRWLITRRRLQPPPELVSPEAWHWPLQIEIMGTRCFTLDGTSLELSTKHANLLSALAGLAADDGWVRRERVCDLVWPDSDGDLAQRALDTTIHRLRKLLGTEAMIQSRAGIIRLNPAFCQVDYWWVQRILASSTVSVEDIERLIVVVNNLSHFVSPNEESFSRDAVIRRIVLYVLRQLDSPISYADRIEHWLESLLEAMPVYERLWRELIRFYSEQGLANDAVAAWERCCSALAQASGLKPSYATYSLVRQWLEPGGD